MQTIVALVQEREQHTQGTRSVQQMIAPSQRSSPPLPPLPEQPPRPNEPAGRALPFWTWFIENPRSEGQ